MKFSDMYEHRLFFDTRKDNLNYIVVNMSVPEKVAGKAITKIVLTNLTRELKEDEEFGDRITIISLDIFKKLYDDGILIPVKQGMIPTTSEV